MNDVIIPYEFLCRGGTAAAIAAWNGIPRARQMIIEIDTGFFKWGNGVTSYNSLPYAGIYPASSIPITDAGDYFGATTVEGALQELGAAESGGGTDLRAVAQFFDECYAASVTTAGWVADNASGSLLVQQTVSDMVGAYAARCGSSLGNRGSATAPGFKVTPGSGEIRCRFRVRPEHVPDASNQFMYVVGLGNGASTGSTDRVWLEATDTTGGWRLGYVTPAGSLNSVVVLPVVAGVTINFDIVFNAAGTSVSFFADDTLIDTLALPYAFAPMHPMFLCRKNGASGGQSTLWIDKVLVEQDQ